MPVHVDLGQFPRLQCRCGQVCLVDPALPPDVLSSVSCPQCRRQLVPARRHTDSAARLTQATKRPSPASSPIPSGTAVGLTIAAIFVLLMIGVFAWLALIPHQHYWWSLTK